jgi:hypothetical protein
VPQTSAVLPGALTRHLGVADRVVSNLIAAGCGVSQLKNGLGMPS